MDARIELLVWHLSTNLLKLLEQCILILLFSIIDFIVNIDESLPQFLLTFLVFLISEARISAILKDLIHLSHHIPQLVLV